MTDDYEVRLEVGNAIYRLVKAAGGEMVLRPVLRSDPGGRQVPEPEPIAAIGAAAAIGHEARRQIHRQARFAREDGRTWGDIADALGRDSDPARVYELLASDLGDGSLFAWSCPVCGGRIMDRGPEYDPADAEQGHADGCARLAAAVRAYDAQWGDGSDA